jgi:hypothetical protein
MRVGQMPVAVRTGCHSGVHKRVRAAAQLFDETTRFFAAITIAPWRIQFWRQATDDGGRVRRRHWLRHRVSWTETSASPHLLQLSLEAGTPSSLLVRASTQSKPFAGTCSGKRLMPFMTSAGRFHTA